MRRHLSALLGAVGFLTRIPVPAAVFDRTTPATSLAWYPLVGAVIGVLLASLSWLIHGLPLPLAAALVLLAWVWLTGALHLDGLADMADAWIGGMGDRERTLAIMKDPRCGPAGVVSLVLVLLLKYAALASPGVNVVALMAAPVLGRTVLVLAFLTTPYVRPGGLGEALRGGSRPAAWFGVAMAVLACALLGGRGLAACGATAALFMIWRHSCMQRLGGMTGDTCGALTESAEAAVLVVLAAMT